LNRSTISNLLEELSLHEKNGKFPKFYEKFFKIFRHFEIFFPSNFDMSKWSSFARVLSNNFNNCSEITIGTQDFPTDFTIFLFSLFKKSQSTLKRLDIACAQEMISLPAISLPNVANASIYVTLSQNNDVSKFGSLMGDISMKCTNLERLHIFFISDAPSVLEYLIENYSNHFLYAPKISVLEHIPIKIVFAKVDQLAFYSYISQVEYLALYVPENFEEGGWDNYQEILNFCPNLKGMTFDDKKSITNLDGFFEDLDSEQQTIWIQRVSYFETKNIQILYGSEFVSVLDNARKNLQTSWSLEFDF
jgi:hypothetical protein